MSAWSLACVISTKSARGSSYWRWVRRTPRPVARATSSRKKGAFPKLRSNGRGPDGLGGVDEGAMDDRRLERGGGGRAGGPDPDPPGIAGPSPDRIAEFPRAVPGTLGADVA